MFLHGAKKPSWGHALADTRNWLSGMLGFTLLHASDHRLSPNKPWKMKSSLFDSPGAQEQLKWVVVAQGLSWGCCQEVNQACSCVKACPGLGDLVWWLLAHMAVQLTLQHLTRWISPWGCLNVFTCDDYFPQSKWSKREPGGSRHVFYKLVSEVTLHHFFNALLLAYVSPIHCRGKEWEERVTRATWDLVTTNAREELLTLALLWVGKGESFPLN